MKRCADCHEIKEAQDFHSCKSRADGLSHYCKDCKRVRARAYYLANHEREKERMRLYRLANPEKVSEVKKRCYEAKKPEYLAACRRRYDEKRGVILEYSARYRQSNKENISARNTQYVRERMKVDPAFKLSYAIRCRVGQAFRTKSIPKRGKTPSMLGCGWEELKVHIESQFQPGMTWENRGEWHVDHKIPLSLAATAEDMERLCHYTNLQPLWALDNIRKGARMAA